MEDIEGGREGPFPVSRRIISFILSGVNNTNTAIRWDVFNIVNAYYY
mgnify:CR=1 FL=1